MTNAFDQFDTEENPFNQFDSYDIAKRYHSGELDGDQKAAVEELGKRGAIDLTIPQWATEHPNLYGLFGAGKALWQQAFKPTLEVGGMVGGGIAGAPLSPGMSVAGAGLGYGFMRQFTGLIDHILAKAEGLTPEDKNLLERSSEALKDIATGATFEAGGQIAGPVISGMAKAGGKVIKPILGRVSGLGTESVTQAVKSGLETGLEELNVLKSSTQFDNALRGKISGEEIVNNAKTALQDIKNIRGETYRAKLEKIKLDKTSMNNIKTDLESKMLKELSPDNFDIKASYGQKGYEFDFSNSTIVEHQNVVKKALEDISKWKDNTPAGLDVLKKRLSTYIDQVKRGTPAEALLNKLERNISDSLKKNIPEYAEMTKGYAEATTIIKDIESGLMLRKQGMTGRIVADQTLRRLLSSMKDNFALRKDLVEVLGSRGNADIMGQIAGYGMGSVLPVGLAGTGPVLIGEGLLAHLISPKLWPVLLASSPRVQGEFLRLYGKALIETTNISPILARSLAYSFKEFSDNNKRLIEGKEKKGRFYEWK